MAIERCLVDKFGTKVSLHDTRTSITVLEEALRVLPDTLLQWRSDPGCDEESLIFYGDNCLGLVLAPKIGSYEVRMDALSGLNEFQTPEGKFVGIRYQGNSYSIKIVDQCIWITHVTQLNHNVFKKV